MGLPRGQWLDPSIPAERSALVEELSLIHI